MIKIGSKCECISGMYFNESKHACQPCGKCCKKCKSDCPDACLSCLNPDAIIFDNKCIPKPGKFEDNPCEINDCHPSCAECSGPGNTNCTVCKGNLILTNGKCEC